MSSDLGQGIVFGSLCYFGEVFPGKNLKPRKSLSFCVYARLRHLCSHDSEPLLMLYDDLTLNCLRLAIHVRSTRIQICMYVNLSPRASLPPTPLLILDLLPSLRARASRSDRSLYIGEGQSRLMKHKMGRLTSCIYFVSSLRDTS